LAQQPRERIDNWNYINKKASAQQKKWLCIEEATHRKRENLCQLCIKELITRICREFKKLNSEKSQWPNEEMGKWTKQSLFKGRSSNG
jgi:hypothetical protein